MPITVDQIPDRIRKRIIIDSDTGCWIWTKAMNSKGYGSVRFMGRVVGAHRLVFELLIGPVPSGMELHHKCENRLCCNPGHLSILSLSEHRRRHTRRYPNGEKTHCINGHPFSESNTWLEWANGKPQRHCRICNKERARQRRMKERVS
jgi:hypothetical protein